MESAYEEFLGRLRESAGNGTFVKLTLGRYRGSDGTLRNLHVRPVTLHAGPHWSFVWRHERRDITKNHPPAEGLSLVRRLIGGDFGTAHLFTTTEDAQLECPGGGRPARMTVMPHATTAVPSGRHDRRKTRQLAPGTPWLQALGVTTSAGQVREGMAAKFRQINRFVELLAPLVQEAPLPADRPVEVADMGCGKGYLTFATWQYFHEAAKKPVHVRGIEIRPELVELCNLTARAGDCQGLEFTAGTIAVAAMDPLDILIALHACDTATDDAIARGIEARAALIVVAPCCHKEISPQIAAPAILAPALRHGIFHERQAEFVTDALRALLLEWAGYDARVFEFISGEHTAKNLMIAAVRRAAAADPEAAAARVREFARFYGVQSQRLARRLGFSLAG